MIEDIFCVFISILLVLAIILITFGCGILAAQAFAHSHMIVGIILTLAFLLMLSIDAVLIDRT